MEISLNQYCRTLLSQKSDPPRTEGPTASLMLAGHSNRRSCITDLMEKALAAWKEDLEGLALFGSFARGRALANSDIDLLVVLNGSVTLDRDVYSRWPLSKFEGREVAPIVVQIPAEGERIGGLWFEVAIDGIVIFDRNLHLNRFLSRVREQIAAGRVKRRMTHGHPYWVHEDQTVRRPDAVGKR